MQCQAMFDTKIIFIAAVFALAGVVKGVVGLGLPTISMGLLALFMPPLQAAAILVVPSFLTNVWQMLAGPSLAAVARRLWPMQIGVCLGTWAGAGWMTGNTAHYGGALLGVALVIYAITGLRSWQQPVARQNERWLGPAVGAITGLVTAATGVFVIPSVPYLQALDLDKEEFVQALGLSFTVSTIALAVNLARAGALNIGMATPTIVALIAACAGMAAGQILRLRLSPEIFRRCFFVGLLLLGVYLAADALR
jgi:uncharacterized membrane protein YfcA